ncbi:MNIO class RiPP chryseobasin precursor ChrA [Chryseobacterium sp. CP-77]|uniref:MNIO class RiPP chryseobasin precursor ChrA n=1 Tax=Chryseobacterium sp. CP-77 TaxID=3116594 RepID=UPI003FA611C9
MKIPAILMASLLAVSVSAQTTKPETKAKKPVKKIKKATSADTVEKKKPGTPKPIVKKDTLVLREYGCPACGMG